jgi:serine protease Do
VTNATRVTEEERKPNAASAIAAMVALALVVLGAGAPAQARGPTEDFAELAEALMPAVVNIATTQRLDPNAELPRFPNGSPLERFNDFLGPDGGQASSLGSGFVISVDGVVVTNNHVIEGADEISVIFHDGQQLEARLVGRDPATDIAVLKVEANRSLAFVEWGDSDVTRVGQWVIAIGNPFGLGGSVSAGIISARNRNIDAGRYDDFIQTDAAINRGNSGGPLFDREGRVIGVNTAIVSPTGGSVGVGFATPAALARPVVDQLLRYGETRRGWLGVRIGAVSPELARRNGLERPRGALVAGVTANSPAERAGLRTGDIILTFNGRDINESRNLTRFVAEAEVDSAVTVEFLRSAKRMSTAVMIAKLDEGRVVLAQAEPTEAAPPGFSLGPGSGLTGAQARLLGMTLAELSPDARRRNAVADDVRGLFVIAVDPSGGAAGKVQPGDVIVEMTFEPVETISQARALAARAERDGARPVLLYINRGGEMTFRSVRFRR